MRGAKEHRKLKKTKRRGVSGRRWKRTDRPFLALGDLDPSGLLTVVNPDLGTRNGYRYASAQCGCGCNMVIEARIDNFRAGKVSCPTRRKEQKRLYMVGKEHIEKMKLLGKMLDASPAVLATAIVVGLDYARRLTTDTALQADVKATYKPDLAARDLKRAAQVAEKYGKAKELVRSGPNAIPASTPQPKLKIEELLAHGIVIPDGPARYSYTVKGDAWKKAGKPPLDTFNFTLPLRQSTPPKEPDLTPLIPYLDVKYGIVAFSRVPPDMRNVDGKNIRDLLVNAGVIDAKLYLTDKGKAWLAQS